MDLQQLLTQTLTPIDLPIEAFLMYNQEIRLVNPMAIIQALPGELRPWVDRELTITAINPRQFVLPVKDGRSLLVELQDCQIVKLELLSRQN
jgi:hypothetical protein